MSERGKSKSSDSMADRNDPLAALSPAVVEELTSRGDLAKLSPEERSQYYLEVCKSLGLNPLTQPLAYIVLNNRLTLYALRACTDQLRAIHGVSVEDLTESEREGVFIVTAKVRNRDGRTDMAKGAVNIAGVKGEQLANSLMRCETKAKRRATLSLCGLGILDETEVEDIAEAQSPPSEPVLPTPDLKGAALIESAEAAANLGPAALERWWKALSKFQQNQVVPEGKRLRALANRSEVSRLGSFEARHRKGDEDA